MSSSMFKVSTDKTEFIVFKSHAQRQELDSYLSVWIFGNFLHRAIIVNNFGVLFDAKLFFADYVCNICNTCFI